jgi:hypothetical protein
VFVVAAPKITVGLTTVNDSDPNTVQLSMTLNNTGPGTAAQLTVTSVAATVLSGAGTVSVEGLPLNANSLAGGQSVALPISIAWPSTATHVRLTVNFTADNGTYQGSQILTLFR